MTTKLEVSRFWGDGGEWGVEYLLKDTAVAGALCNINISLRVAASRRENGARSVDLKCRILW